MDDATGSEDVHQSLKTSLWQAVVLTTLVGIAALLVNLFHPNRIPVFATEEYETMVPCPDSQGSVDAINPSTLLNEVESTVFVDARYEDDFAVWHYQGAYLLTYDYLDPVPEDELNELAGKIAARGAKRVVVYGDGDTPDTGELLGGEISGAGIRNVFYVKGGASALEAALKKGAGR